MTLSSILRAATIAATLALSTVTFAADIDVNANQNDLAIKGFDTVAYFTDGKAVKGNVNYTATYKNAIYQFASEQNRDLFKQNPEKYAPQYGGYCAFGVTMERKFDTDPTAFKIVDNKLYLNLNADVQKRWVTDIPGFVSAADDNWNGIKSKTDEELESE
ncbi:YHS domain-containing (seleno)protein [Glaciecola siphonariae]|uniref:YHS domain-containing (Seleno)protein n=1 Tax=Glaciecola siphonariae TaxID=521012 RepID=A0ABV9LZF8_9ALTE